MTAVLFSAGDKFGGSFALQTGTVSSHRKGSWLKYVKIGRAKPIHRQLQSLAEALALLLRRISSSPEKWPHLGRTLQLSVKRRISLRLLFRWLQRIGCSIQKLRTSFGDVKAVQDRYEMLQKDYDHADNANQRLCSVSGGETGELADIMMTMREARQDLDVQKKAAKTAETPKGEHKERKGQV